MREIYRPIHSAFESLKLRRDPQCREVHYNRRAFPANEQMTALGFAASRGQQRFFEQGFSR